MLPLTEGDYPALIAMYGVAGGHHHLYQMFVFGCFCIALAGASGLRCTVPLFLVSYYCYENPEKMHGAGILSFIGSGEFTMLMGVLMVAEILLDKIPLVDHALHVALLVGAPLAGAAICYSHDAPVLLRWFLVVVGAVFALGVHSARSALRAGSTATTGGFCNCVLSLVEDIAVFIIVFTLARAALVALIFVIIFGIVMIVGFTKAHQHMKSGEKRQHQLQRPQQQQQQQQQQQHGYWVPAPSQYAGDYSAMAMPPPPPPAHIYYGMAPPQQQIHYVMPPPQPQLHPYQAQGFQAPQASAPPPPPEYMNYGH
eukprot:NODE_14629_length_1096_cov_13.809082.p1 GENE.NODE_14629_length_1096_cov_13.809082~~NODE_14629_length_1096_cov_13.809082.p1  ORF type:complete len:312 (+),score=99.69 NODE_14629_length_1096_cov_13.809082:72-1007(+)